MTDEWAQLTGKIRTQLSPRTLPAENVAAGRQRLRHRQADVVQLLPLDDAVTGVVFSPVPASDQRRVE